MGEHAARPQWRDVLPLLVVASVLLAGLVHYGLQVADERAADPADPAPSGAPRAVARLDSAASAAASPTPSVVCWDGRTTSSLASCGLPEGAAGLRWVYPSLAASGEGCSPTDTTGTGYVVVHSFVCFATAAGRPVTLTYDQVADAEAAHAWLSQAYSRGNRFEIQGPHGGRALWKDGSSRPVRISGTYDRFPYVATVYAPTLTSAKRAWKTLVSQRAPRAVRGPAA